MFNPFLLLQDFSKTLKLALPMILGQVIGVSMSFVDATMLGRGVGTESLAALGLGMNIVQILGISGFGFVAAVSILVSQNWGAKRHDDLMPILRHGIVICLIFACITLLLLAGFMEHASWFNYMGQPEHIVQLAKPYVYLLSVAFIFTYYNSCTRGYCQGQNIVWFPLLVLSSTIILNILFNWIFIFGKLGFQPMGIVGAGIGSMLSQICGTVLITVILEKSSRYKYSFKELISGKIHIKTLKKVLCLGFPIFLEILGEVSGLSFIAFMVGSLGDAALAAHHGASEVSIMSYIIVMATSNAVAIRIGQASGAQDFRLLQIIKSSSLIFSLLIGTLFTIIFILLRNQIPYFYTEDIQVVNISASIFVFIGIYQIIDMLAVMSSGLLNGMGYVKIPMVASLLGKLIIMVPLGYVLGIYFNTGVKGLWLAITVGIYIFGIIVFFKTVTTTTPKKAEA